MIAFSFALCKTNMTTSNSKERYCAKAKKGSPIGPVAHVRSYKIDNKKEKEDQWSSFFENLAFIA